MTSPAKTPKEKFLELSTYLQDELLDKVWDCFSQIQEDDQLVHNNLSEIEKKYQALFLNWKKMKQSDVERQHEDIVSQYEFTKTISDQKIACVSELFDEIQLQKTKLDGIIEEYIESQENKDQLRQLMKTRDKNLQDDFKRLNKNLKRKYRKRCIKQERQLNPSASSSKEKVSVKKTSTIKAAKAVVEAKKSTGNQTVSLPADTASESKVSIENQVAKEKVSTSTVGSSDSQNCQIVSASSCDLIETSINATSSTSVETNESADLEDSPKSVAYILDVIGAISNPSESAEPQAITSTSLVHQERPTASSEATCQITSPDGLQKDQSDRPPSAGQVDSRPQTAGTTSQKTSEINKREICSEELAKMSLVTAEQSQQYDRVDQATEQQESRQSDQRDHHIQSQTIIQPNKPESKLDVETTVGCTKTSSTTAVNIVASANTLATDPLKRRTGSNKPIGASQAKKYCICKKEAYGEMVGCENSECSIEWFHYSCVNLDAPPETEWYCTLCDTEEKRQNKSSNRQI